MCFTPASCPAISLGCWWKSAEIPKRLSQTCDFYLYKKGIFSRNGTLKVTGPENDHEYLWVTHRMSVSEKLTKIAGQKLGTALSEFAGKAKFIELDIEPVKNPEVLLEFLTGVRERLDPKLKLTLATPFLSEVKTGALSWDERHFETVLPSIDGLEMMLYDTGATTEREYLDHLEEALNAMGRWSERYPQKAFTLGVPAYPESTRLHRPQVENLSVVAKSKLLGKFPSLRLAVYAGWTMTEKDHSVSTTIKSSPFR